ncbi:type III secretion system chaperone [Bremerella sp. JC770]|uniref:type III secretion system chaperone n=1 Tax=Bremerella sp. JC770 TaxID=3232137 RepID=UPI0034580879
MTHLELIDALGVKLGLDQLAFDENQTCRLIFANEIVVDMEWDQEDHTLLVYTALGPEPEAASPFYREMMIANLFGAGTEDAVLAVHSELQEVILFRSFPGELLEIDPFFDQLLKLLDRVDYWSKRLADCAFEQQEKKDAEGIEAALRRGTPI